MHTNRLPRLLVVLSICLMTKALRAEYIVPQLVDVPVDRLSKNLQEQLEKLPVDAPAKGKPQRSRILLNLARLHAMAYAKKTDVVKAWKNREQHGAWFGYEPKHVPFQAVDSENAAKNKAAKDQLAKAISMYERCIKLDPNNFTARLGHAWCLDQAGQKMRAIQLYRTLIEDAWNNEQKMKFAGLGWHSVAAEASGYLAKLVGGKDREDVLALQKTIVAHMNSIPRPITPIAIPLEAGLSLTDIVDENARVRFDADGSGLVQPWTWIRPNAGWLVHDPRQTGRITSATQMFGNFSFMLLWDHGYQALASLDDDGDGELRGRELHDLAIWHDANQNGRSDDGEVRPLRGWQIESLSCRLKFTAAGVPFSAKGVTTVDGEVRPTWDVILKRAD